jgi:hypothetical protein
MSATIARAALASTRRSAVAIDPPEVTVRARSAISWRKASRTGTTLPYATRAILFGLVVLSAVIALRHRQA